MTDATLAQPFAPALRINTSWLDAIAHRGKVLRRRARRDRYLALTGRCPRRYPWFEILFTSMSGR
jgi:hypothetical protein